MHSRNLNLSELKGRAFWERLDRSRAPKKILCPKRFFSNYLVCQFHDIDHRTLAPFTEGLPMRRILWTGRIGSLYVSTKFPLFVCRHWLLILNLSSSFTSEATKVSEPADIVMGVFVVHVSMRNTIVLIMWVKHVSEELFDVFWWKIILQG